MKEIIEIINQIAATSGRNDKELILKQNKNNELLKEIFQFVYNPYVVTGLSNKKINKKVKSINTDYISGIRGLMEYLLENNTGTDKDIKSVQDFINTQSVEPQELYKQIATKSLKIGVTAKTLNKIYGKDFIPEFNVMLAEKYFDYENKIADEFCATLKLDGMRIAVIKESGNNIQFFTRQGQQIEGLVEIIPELKQLPNGYVYDGELLALNPDGLSSKDLYRKTVAIGRKDGVKKGLQFHMFDIVKINSFKNGIDRTICTERKELLHNIISNNNFKYIVEVPILYKGNDKNKIIELLNDVTKQNLEGIMVNIADAPYECKRTKNILKVKVMQTCECRCVGFEEGLGINKGTLGAIIFEYKNNTVKCGSGFALKPTNIVPIENTRDYIWNNKDKFLNKIFELQYFEETTNQKQEGVISVRFPVFLNWRPDKTEPSYY